MNIEYINTASGLKTVLAARDTYFIVEREIALQALQYTLGKGSVIEFSGGRFKGVSGTSLNLAGGQVIADPYPVFQNMEVTGFSNSRVYAEWFADNADTDPHIYINKALRLAKGCPVVLAKNEYRLTGTIVFPASSPSTLIAAGSLVVKTDNGDDGWKTNPVAIDVNVSNVHLDINKIVLPGKKIEVKDDKGNSKTITVPEKGTGVRISGEALHVSINVNTILYPERGVDISPGRAGTYASVQYVDIRFQSIKAVYGIYIDIFSNGKPDQTWLTRSSIQGGRLQGSHGIYVKEGPHDFGDSHISEMRFSNIGLESLEESAIYLRHITRSKFDNLRMAEGLPQGDKAWIDLKDVSRLEFDIHGALNADKIVYDSECSRIKIKGSFLQNTRWKTSPFDTLVIDSVWTGKSTALYRLPLKALTCSVSPFQMTNTVTKASDLQEIQPTAVPAVAGKFDGVKVLPRIMQFKVSSPTTINLKGLEDYAPCLYSFSVEGGGVLTLESSSFTKELSKAGVYQLVRVVNGGAMGMDTVPLQS